MAIDYRPQLSGDERRELLWTGLKIMVYTARTV